MLCLKIFITFLTFICTLAVPLVEVYYDTNNSTDVVATVIYEEDLLKSLHSEVLQQLSDKIGEINESTDVGFSKQINEFRKLFKDLQVETINAQRTEIKTQAEVMQNNFLNMQKQLTELKNQLQEEQLEHRLFSEEYNKNTQNFPSTCEQALYGGGTRGVYKLQIPKFKAIPFSAYCEKDPNDGAAWMIIQRRMDASVDFYRNWTEYKSGFGNRNSNYFIGLELLHQLINNTKHELWVQVRDHLNVTWNGNYSNFVIGNEQESYVLHDVGTYTGLAGESLEYHLGCKFSTKDMDNDQAKESNCAALFKGGWWYNNCYQSNLNGRFLVGTHSETERKQGLSWNNWRGNEFPLTYAHMAIRPTK